MPAVQRARRGLGPRRARNTSRPRRRPLGDQRSEGVEHECTPRRFRPARRAHGLGRAEAPRDHLLRAADAAAGHRGAAAAPDEPPCVVQRGVPHGRDRPARSGRRIGRRRLAGRADDAGVRTAIRRDERRPLRGGDRSGAARGGRGGGAARRHLCLVPTARRAGGPARRTRPCSRRHERPDRPPADRGDGRGTAHRQLDGPARTDRVPSAARPAPRVRSASSR